ncbi:MAG: trypsin-like serine protease [Proteobacteria bacterium]|nr:MAG: trypsin-like serine protease [Pseudomonadota bacterium]
MRSSLPQTKASIALLGLGLLIEVSCGPQPKSTSEAKIFGGRPVLSGNRLDAIALTDEEGIFCSGTAVSPTLVLTAAHCAVDLTAEDVRVYVGAGETGGMQVGQYAVEKVAVNPLYDENDQDKGSDSAYLLLKNPIDLPPESFTTILTDPAEAKELLRGGSDTYLVGFGWNKKDVIGVKYEAKGVVRKLFETEVSLGGKGRDACQGDSGGPAYGLLKSGEWRVYGITSRGSDCGQGGIWGLMSANICWALKDSGALDVKIPAAYCAGENQATKKKR